MAKRGCMQEAVEQLKQVFEVMGMLQDVRIYVSNIGSFDMIATEFEVKDLAEYQELLKKRESRLSRVEPVT